MSEPNDDDVEITSPPYPNLACRSANLFRQVSEFYGWLREQSRQLIVDVDRHVDVVPEDSENYKSAIQFQKFVHTSLESKASCGSLSQWEQLGVVDHYNVWSTLRGLRESWDTVIRDHETEWRELRAFPCRLHVLATASHFAGDVFLSSEVREHRVTQERERRQKAFDAVRQQIGKMLHKSGFQLLDINVLGEGTDPTHEPKSEDPDTDSDNEDSDPSEK